MTGKVETGENVNPSVSVRSDFMQAACSANRKKCQAVSFRPGGDITFSWEGQGHGKAFGKRSYPSLDRVSQPECAATPKEEQVNMMHIPAQICQRSIFHLGGA